MATNGRSKLTFRLPRKRSAIFATALAMITTDRSAKEPSLWYMDLEPIFERSYREIENGRAVQRTERLTTSEVNEIVDELARNDEFMSTMREYVAVIKQYGNEVPREKDVEIGQRFRPHIDAAFEKKHLKMDYFFSNSIAIEILQRIESGKIGVEN